MKKFRYIVGTATLQLNKERCIGCGNCVTVCPHRVFQLADNKAIVSDINGCMECGACALNCPVEAVTVQPGVGCVEAYINMWISKITGKERSGNNCC